MNERLTQPKEELLDEICNILGRDRRRIYKSKSRNTQLHLVGEWQSVHMKKEMLINAFINKEQRTKSTGTNEH